MQQKRPPDEIKSVDLSNYTPFFWYDRKGDKHCFMGGKQTLKGGESTVRFGYDVDDERKIISSEKALRIVRQNQRSRDQYKEAIKLEIVVAKILYENTSPMMRFHNGELGYSMDILPGIDFLKKPKHRYTGLLIHKQLDKKIEELEFKDNQLVLSEHGIFWREDGKIKSVSLEEIEATSTLIAKQIREYVTHEDGSVFSIKALQDVELFKLKTLIQQIENLTHCRARTLTSYDFTKFEQLNLSFLERCQIARDLSRQLSKLHQQNYFHGDINPTNIKLHKHDGNVYVYLFDFGQSRLATTLVSDYSVGASQDFLSPEASEHKYTKASDVFSLAGIIGMLFTKNPNYFIKDRLLRGRELTEYVDMISMLSTTAYNIDEMFIGMHLGTSTKEKKQLKEFLTALTQNSESRPSSQDAATFFDSLIKERYFLFVYQCLMKINTRPDTFLPAFIPEFEKRYQHITQSNFSVNKVMAELAKEIKMLEQYCEMAYQYKDIPHKLPELVTAYQDKIPLIAQEIIPPKPVTIFMPPSEKIKRATLLKLANKTIGLIMQSDNIGNLFNEIVSWARLALIYQQKKTQWTPGRLFSQGTLTDSHQLVTNFLEEIIRHHGDMSKLVEQKTLKEKFLEIKKVHPHGTVISYFETILLAYDEKLTQLIAPSSEQHPSLKLH